MANSNQSAPVPIDDHLLPSQRADVASLQRPAQYPRRKKRSGAFWGWLVTIGGSFQPSRRGQWLGSVQKAGQNQVISQLYKHACNLVLVSNSRLCSFVLFYFHLLCLSMPHNKRTIYQLEMPASCLLSFLPSEHEQGGSHKYLEHHNPREMILLS